MNGRLPKFWKDTGRYNDPVVSISITLSLVLWEVLGWGWMMLAAVILGPITGLLFAFLLIYLLCTYCNAKDR